MLKQLFAIVLVSTCVAGEAATSTRPLTPSEKVLIEHSIRAQLNDPDSAQFRHNPLQTTQKRYCGLVNAKNRMGGYVGYKVFEVTLAKEGVTIKNVVDAYIVMTDDENDGMKGLTGMITTAACVGSGYKVTY